ncbi:CyP450 monooxygenase [Schizopora paradoxa]|uniref:CyP450 monooxygenase n=1 Tax=Schizopora paradoxa TaxID=27342 RepID=A0A0H2R3X1_9AGAM|nr:CyP450 monooxygenase [Schizopora paradoxa]
MLLSVASLDALVLCTCLVWLRQLVLRKRHTVPLPPGPRRLPLIGNVLDMPKTLIWEKAAEWKNKYGDIIYLENFGVPLVIINSYDIAVDLLDKGSIKYSSRPSPVMFDELQDWAWLLVMIPYGSRWRTCRAPIQKAFNSPSVNEFMDIQLSSSRLLLSNILREPNDYNAHIKASVARTIMLTTYGHEVLQTNDPFISLAEEGVIYAGESAVPGRFLVDIIPWLKYVPSWFPGAEFKKIARRGRKLSHDMRYVPYEDSKEKILKGEMRPSLTQNLIEECLTKEGNLTPEHDDMISAVTGMVYAGGTDTTGSALQTFILAMTLHPEVQMRAHEEIDRVVGSDRLPDFDDRESVPYVEAIVKECLRWNQPLPLGIPHFLTEDDVYGGHFIPAGTIVAANQWCMMNNPVEFSEPKSFKPERFLPDTGKTLPLDPSKVVFGFGRRICAGKMMAENSLFITVASILAAFDIAAPLDEFGRPSPPSGEYNPTSIVSHPVPFDCRITPRSEKAAALITQSVDLQA